MKKLVFGSTSQMLQMFLENTRLYEGRRKIFHFNPYSIA